MTEQFDLSALEKALSTKSRKPRQNLSLNPSLSKQELYDEARRLVGECKDIYNLNLRTRHQGDSYNFGYGSLFKNNDYVNDIETVPRAVFEKLVTNGRRHLKDYHEMINAVIMQNPTLALEANLEGKTNREVLSFAYFRRLGEIKQIVERRVSSPNTDLYLNFNITMKPPLGPKFDISVTWWAHRPSVNVIGVDLHPKKPAEIAKLVHFLNHTEQAIDEINRQLDTIEIRKGATK